MELRFNPGESFSKELDAATRQRVDAMKEEGRKRRIATIRPLVEEVEKKAQSLELSGDDWGAVLEMCPKFWDGLCRGASLK